MTVYGCDKRPCAETEMCAPVRNRVSYVCIPLGELPRVPNSKMEFDGVISTVYTCAKGRLSVSTCDRVTRTWSEVDIKCTQLTCNAPPNVQGAVVRLFCLEFE
ncbi:hypothetical protein PoB_004824300 [Plakobranchus ocellatus]|uniref:Sushi domain-containing protein n=1 Tax=Plakobranchus ocellatus TaxID=259542 RepID=A0AAV4BRI0_9GAST|nr:hypothetical protein PoB_004824300 [Plakobranchus ocellatus]